MEVPVTERPVVCIMHLLRMSPQITQAYIGSLSASVLFSADKIHTEDYSRLVLNTYLKLRQIPKLVSKMLQAVGNNPKKVKTKPLDKVFPELFAECVLKLPLGQVPELWKTVLFHLKQDVVEGTIIGGVLVPILLYLIYLIFVSLFKSNACLKETSRSSILSREKLVVEPMVIH